MKNPGRMNSSEGIHAGVADDQATYHRWLTVKEGEWPTEEEKFGHRFSQSSGMRYSGSHTSFYRGNC